MGLRCHARNKYINRAAVLFAKSPKGIDYNSLDGQPVHLFFMITAPAGADSYTYKHWPNYLVY